MEISSLLLFVDRTPLNTENSRVSSNDLINYTPHCGEPVASSHYARTQERSRNKQLTMIRTVRNEQQGCSPTFFHPVHTKNKRNNFSRNNHVFRALLDESFHPVIGVGRFGPLRKISISPPPLLIAAAAPIVTHYPNRVSRFPRVSMIPMIVRHAFESRTIVLHETVTGSRKAGRSSSDFERFAAR